MLLPRFDFQRPHSVSETCEILERHGTAAKLLAGGTDLLVSLKRKLLAPEFVVAVDRVAELEGVENGNQVLSVGSLTTAAQLAGNRSVKKLFPALSQAAGGLGTPPIRNRATTGGNLVTARPAADLIPPLVVLDATVLLRSMGGLREIPVAQFVTGPGQTLLDSNEVLTRVVVPRPEPGSGSAYIKFGARQSCEISIVSVAVFVSLTPAGRKIKSAKICLGAVAPKPLRCTSAEELLASATPRESSFAAAGQAAARASRPITDQRGSAQYRRQMVDVLTRRALAAATEVAREDLARRNR